MNNKTGKFMRIVHRYLGFFLAGIMAMYALSGVVLIFRDTDFLKREKEVTQNVGPNMTPEELGGKLHIRGLKVDKQEGDVLYFEQGNYNSATGEAVYTSKNLPSVLDKMTKLHKASSRQPLFWLNIFFGLSLLFFVVSSFWMFRPASSIFRKGLYFTIGGIVMTIVLLFV